MNRWKKVTDHDLSLSMEYFIRTKLNSLCDENMWRLLNFIYLVEPEMKENIFSTHYIFCIVPLEAEFVNVSLSFFFTVTLGIENKSTTSCPRWEFCPQSLTVTLCVWSARMFPLALLTCAPQGSLVSSTWCGRDAARKPWRSQWASMDLSTSCTHGKECS